MGNNHITIIGGAGFLGQGLVTKLLEVGYNVTIADRSIKDQNPFLLKKFNEFIKNKQLELVYLDITDVDTFKSIPKDSKIVIQAAGYFSFWPVNYYTAYKVNIGGTRNICNFVSDHPNIETFLFYSSTESIGPVRDRSQLPGAKENTRPLESEFKKCLYKETKSRAHNLVEGYAGKFEKNDKRLLIHAPPTPFGPGMENIVTGDLIKKDTGLIKWICPKTVLSGVHTDDLHRDDLLILEKGVNGKTYVSVGFHASIPQLIAAKINIMKNVYNMKNAAASRFRIPNWSLKMIATSMELAATINKNYIPEMTLEQAIRTSQNHWYDTTMTKKELGLNENDYLGLEDTMKKVCKYFYDNRLFTSMSK